MLWPFCEATQCFLLHLEPRSTERNEGGSFIGGSSAEWASYNNEIKIIFLTSPVTRRPQMGVTCS